MIALENKRTSENVMEKFKMNNINMIFGGNRRYVEDLNVTYH